MSYEELEKDMMPFIAVRLLTMETESGRELPPAAIDTLVAPYIGL